MNQTMKTLGFVAVAAVSVVVAAGTYYANRPVDLNDFSDVGSKFYPKFDDPNEATGLQVAAYQEETGKTELFKVDVKDGQWVIPSHHDYPADAQDRLAKTAASMVGVERLALIERTKAAQKRYGVIDPLDKDSGTEGRGDRITLYKGNEVLVDFIVGKKVENSDNLYYVRRADEDRIYTADLGRFDISTKFSDWIKKDVLEITRSDVNEILIGRYHVDELQGRVIQQGQIDLTRESGTSDWKLNGLKEGEEQLKGNEVNSLLSSLDELQIVGVRPKPAGLSAGLKGNADSISIDPFVRRDMQEKGVFISPRGEFVYNEGKVNVGLNNGVVYELGFGEEFTGTDIDIEIGKQTPPGEVAEEIAERVEAPADKADEAAEKQETAKTEGDEKEENASKTSRYLFVTAYFDKSLLGPEPVAPVKPEPPAEKKEEAPAEKSEEAKEEKPAEEAKSAEEKAEAETPAEEKADKPAESAPADPEAEYKKALEEYKLQQEVYEQKKKDYEAKLKAGEERVSELNRRFADWYYVISEETFAKLKLKREDLVEAVKKEEQAAEDSAPKSPAAESPETAQKPAAMEKPAGDKPAEGKSDETAAGEEKKSDTPAGEMKKEATPPASEKPAAGEESKPAESKPAEEKPADPKPADEKPAEPAPAEGNTPAPQE